MTNSMVRWTKEAALIQLQRAEKTYSDWKLEVIQNPNDDYKRSIMNDCEAEVKRMITIYNKVV